MEFWPPSYIDYANANANNLASDQGQSINHDSSGSGQLTGSAAALAAVEVSAWANLTHTGEGNLAPRLTWWWLQAKAGPPSPPSRMGQASFVMMCVTMSTGPFAFLGCTKGCLSKPSSSA